MPDDQDTYRLRGDPAHPSYARDRQQELRERDADADNDEAYELSRERERWAREDGNE